MDIERRFRVEGGNNHREYHTFASDKSAVNIDQFRLEDGYRFVKVESAVLSRDTGEEVDAFKLGLIHDATETIAYFVECHLVDLGLANPVTQCTVWRSDEEEHEDAVSGFAGKVFEGYLLGQYDLIISDSIQSQMGMKFWMTRLKRAFKRNKFVYVVEDNTHINQLATITDLYDIEEEIWTEETTNNKRLLISNTKIA
ncbi:hypothetical protein ACWJJH_14255 [Endozoicomonadaceae bacterium StTr2]